MPELPEIHYLATQMNDVLYRKTVAAVDVRQEKCLNLPVSQFKELILACTIDKVFSRGKWLFLKMSNGVHLLINLGMGGEIRFHPAGESVDGRYQFLFAFTDQTSIHIAFSWFGYVHAVARDCFYEHPMTASLGICPLSDDFTADHFLVMLQGKKGGIKAYLMNQHHVAGIGNVYIQDILFQAGLHPNRKIDTIPATEQVRLHGVIVSHLQRAAGLGGLVDETDLFGNPGRYTYDLVGHRPGAPCPNCGTPVQEIRTGSTRSFICSQCQK